MSEKHKWTSKEIITAVRKHYGAERDNFGPEYATLTEYSLRPGVGWRRADLYVVRAWAGRPKGHERTLIEVKVSRSDFLREMAQPQKMADMAAVSHRVYFATPEGVIKDTDDLGDAGHMLVTSRGVSIVRRAKRNNNPDPIPEEAFVEAMRRASRAEARERGVVGDPVSELLALRKEHAALKRRAEASENKRQSEMAALTSWINMLASVPGVPCHCGATMSKSRRSELKRGYLYGAHADGSPCPQGYPQADLEALVKMLMERKV